MLYSGKFSYGANFRIFRTFHLYMKIKTRKIFARGLNPRYYLQTERNSLEMSKSSPGVLVVRHDIPLTTASIENDAIVIICSFHSLHAHIVHMVVDFVWHVCSLVPLPYEIKIMKIYSKGN